MISTLNLKEEDLKEIVVVQVPRSCSFERKRIPGVSNHEKHQLLSAGHDAGVRQPDYLNEELLTGLREVKGILWDIEDSMGCSG